jgi:glycosyltransferase involved in cell wall biosynthesis
MFSPMALQAAYYFSPAMQDKIATLLATRQFDVLHVEHLQASAVVPERCHLPMVYDAVDCITALYAQFARQKPSLLTRLLSQVEWLKLSTYEPLVARRFDQVVVTSEKDKEELLHLDPYLPVEVVRNGVDLEYFTSSGTCLTPTLIFSGKMSYYANEAAAVFFCEQILPLICKQLPETTLVIAGSTPSKTVQRLGQHGNVHITGSVPDLRPVFQRARVAVCPIVVGAGIQNKVLEAMAMGKPVVATSKACQALSVSRGQHLLIADDPKAFADAVVKLLLDDNLAVRLGREGRRYVEEHHNWHDRAVELERVYENAQRAHWETSRLQPGDVRTGS